MRVHRTVMVGALCACFGVPAAAWGQSVRWCDRLPRPEYGRLERVSVADDWFQVYKVADRVYAIYEPYQIQEVISYLILGTQAALLFDTGMGMSRISAVVGELTSLPVQVLNSHTHFDHIGGNAEFEHIVALDTAFTRGNARHYPAEVYRDEAQPDALCRGLPGGLTAATWHIRPFTPEKYITDGYRIDLGGRELEVLHVPGHTPDAVALLDARARILWTGDNYYDGPIWLFFPETDLDEFQASIDRLAALVPELDLLLTSHNTPIARPTRLLQLKEALMAVRSGKVSGKASPAGQIEFSFDGFSILTSRAALAPR